MCISSKHCTRAENNRWEQAKGPSCSQRTLFHRELKDRLNVTFWPESLLKVERMKGNGDRTLGLRAASQSELKKCEKGALMETDTLGQRVRNEKI